MAPRMDYEGYIQINKDRRFWTCLPYPPDTNAFLYYFMPRGKPSIAGELRLRLTSSGDPASFESGSDLLGTNGQPWSRPLPYLPRYYLPLYEKLREEELVSDGLDRVLSTLPSKFPSYRAPHRLYTLDDTFIIDFSCNRLYFHVITEKASRRCFSLEHLGIVVKYATAHPTQVNIQIAISCYFMIILMNL